MGRVRSWTTAVKALGLGVAVVVGCSTVTAASPVVNVAAAAKAPTKTPATVRPAPLPKGWTWITVPALGIRYPVAPGWKSLESYPADVRQKLNAAVAKELSATSSNGSVKALSTALRTPCPPKFCDNAQVFQLAAPLDVKAAQLVKAFQARMAQKAAGTQTVKSVTGVDRTSPLGPAIRLSLTTTQDGLTVPIREVFVGLKGGRTMMIVVAATKANEADRIADQVIKSVSAVPKTR